jgi:predicted GNAT family acetyltransferase
VVVTGRLVSREVTMARDSMDPGLGASAWIRAPGRCVGQDGRVTTATTGTLRVLTSQDLPELHRLLDRDPAAHCFVASRVQAAGLDPWRLGGEIWGWTESGALVSALYLGANMVPIETTAQARLAFSERARRMGRRCSSIVGPHDDVLPLWQQLADSWGPSREVRANQPLLVMDGPPRGPADPLVRPVRIEELDILMPACVAMFTEEVGVSPLIGGGTEGYRSRIADIIRSGRAFARIERGRVVFKAEVGAVSPQACQVQGVWMDPQLRGRGLAGPAMAAVVEYSQRIAPLCTLYVNDFNAPARAVYARVGFRQADTFATILF